MTLFVAAAFFMFCGVVNLFQAGFSFGSYVGIKNLVLAYAGKSAVEDFTQDREVRSAIRFAFARSVISVVFLTMAQYLFFLAGTQ